jgi:hypothetical protein
VPLARLVRSSAPTASVTDATDDAHGAVPARPETGRPDRFPHWRELVGGGVYAALLLVVLRIAAAPLTNTDTYFHLRFGHEFLQGWSLRHPGSVSTFATATWLPTQWLPEMVMAKTEDWFGLAGVAWLLGVMLVSLLATLYLLARRWAGPLAASALSASALFVSSVNLSMRPQVLSFLLVAVFTAAWLRTREDQRVRWWLVPLTWLWAMIHGMWPIGIGLGVVAVVGMALDRSLPATTLRRAAWVPVFSAIAAALTPVGPGLYGAVLGVGSRSQYFSEWDTPDFTNPSCVVLGILLAVSVTMMVRRGDRSFLHLGLLLTAAVCAVWSWRTVPVSAMLLAPLIAVQIHSEGAKSTTPARFERLLVVGISVLALGGLAVAVPRTADQPPSQPSWIDPALSSLPAGTKVVDSWDWGGYLMWRYPQLDLLMHGYGDTFTIPELQRNTDILELAPGWDTQLRRTGCTIAILRPTSALAYALVRQEHWTVLHRSTAVMELRAPAARLTPGGGS